MLRKCSIFCPSSISEVSFGAFGSSAAAPAAPLPPAALGSLACSSSSGGCIGPTITASLTNHQISTQFERIHTSALIAHQNNRIDWVEAHVQSFCLFKRLMLA